MPITSAYLERRIVDTSGSPKWTPGMANVRREVEFPQGPHEAPDPIRQSDYNNEGKPLNHAMSRVQVATAFNMQSTLSIMQEDFARAMIEPRDVWTSPPPGRQLVWGDRVNARRTPAIAYGSLFQLEPFRS